MTDFIHNRGTLDRFDVPRRLNIFTGDVLLIFTDNEIIIITGFPLEVEGLEIVDERTLVAQSCSGTMAIRNVCIETEGKIVSKIEVHLNTRPAVVVNIVFIVFDTIDILVLADVLTMISTFQLNISDEAAFALIQSVFFEDTPPIGRFRSRTLINDFRRVFPCIRKACAE